MPRPRAVLLWLLLLCLIGCTSTRPVPSAEHGTIDPKYLALIQAHYPDTAPHPTPGKPIIFEKVRCIGSVRAEGTMFHAIVVRRRITDMLAPRGISDLVVVDDRGELLKREALTEGAKLDGSILYLGATDVGVDLGSSLERRLWSTNEIGLVDASNSLGFWYERLRSALHDLPSSDPESVTAALKPEWNSSIIGINILTPSDAAAESITLAEFARRFQHADIAIHRPTVSDVQFTQTHRTEYDRIERPWAGIVRASIIDQHDERWDIHFLLAGAKPGS